MHKIIKYGLVVHRDRKFLINRKYGTRLFLMPGGKPKTNESVDDCLTREMKEEHSVTLITDSIHYFGTFEDTAANEPDTIVSMKVYMGEILGEPTINSEIAEQKWFGKNDDPTILSPIIKNKILPALMKEDVI